MSKKTNSRLAEHCKSKLGEHYLYGAKGEVITVGKVRQWAAAYPKYYRGSRPQKASNWAGEMATDCSGLISWYTGTVRSLQDITIYSTKKLVKTQQANNKIITIKS